MATKRRIALLIDVDNVKISKDAVTELFEKLNKIGEVVYCKFYGYNDRKHLYLSELISNYGYETAPFMRLKKRFSQLDNRIIVDAVRINYTKPDIDSFCFVTGEGDLIPLLVELKSCGKTVIDVNTEYQPINAHMFDEHLVLDTINQEVEAYEAVKAKKTTSKKNTTKKKEDTARVAVVNKPKDDIESQPQPEPQPQPQPEIKSEPKTESKIVEEKIVTEIPQPIVSNQVEEVDEDDNYDEGEDFDDSNLDNDNNFDEYLEVSPSDSELSSNNTKAVDFDEDVDNDEDIKESFYDEDEDNTDTEISKNVVAEPAKTEENNISNEDEEDDLDSYFNSVENEKEITEPSNTKNSSFSDNQDFDSDSDDFEDKDDEDNFDDEEDNFNDDDSFEDDEDELEENNEDDYNFENDEDIDESDQSYTQSNNIPDNNEYDDSNSYQSNSNYQEPKNYIDQNAYQNSNNYLDDAYQNDNNVQNNSTSNDYDLSEILKDITNRYNNLDFTSEDNLDEKLRLIRDIENLIESENAKGDGIYSDNEDIRQIFTDLQDVVDDMKSTL